MGLQGVWNLCDKFSRVDVNGHQCLGMVDDDSARFSQTWRARLCPIVLDAELFKIGVSLLYSFTRLTSLVGSG